LSAYDNEIEGRIRRNALYSVKIVKQLEKDIGARLGNDTKARLVGQLCIAASIEGLTVYANKTSKGFDLNSSKK
jgi:hypothetical protein